MEKPHHNLSFKLTPTGRSETHTTSRPTWMN